MWRPMRKCQENSSVFYNLFGAWLFWEWRLFWHNFRALKTGGLLQIAPSQGGHESTLQETNVKLSLSNAESGEGISPQRVLSLRVSELICACPSPPFYPWCSCTSNSCFCENQKRFLVWTCHFGKTSDLSQSCDTSPQQFSVLELLKC